MSLATEIGGCLVLASCFFGGALLDTAFWRLHSKSVRKRLDEMDDRQRRNVAELLPLAEKAAENVKGYREEIGCLAERVLDLEGRMKSVNAWESAMTGAQIDRNIEMDGIRDRIDALSTRMDAVELTCGVREKPKTMGGAE